MDVFRQAGIQKRALQRRVIAAAQIADQSLDGGQLLPLVERSGDEAARGPVPSGRILVRARLVRDVDRAAVHGSLKGRGGHPSRVGPSGQVFLVQKPQHARQRDGPVQEHVGVGRGVEAPVGRQEGLIGQVGDAGRIAAGNEAVGRIRKQAAVQGVHRQFVGIGEGSFHLIEDHAAVLPGPVLARLVVPALLPEDLRLRIDGRAEDGVQIHADQIHEIRLVPAGDGIHGLVRERKGVEERVQRALHQFDERLLDRIEPGSAEDRVLQDVKNAGIVLRKRGKGDAEGLVFVGPVQPDQLKASVLVPHLVQVGRQLGEPNLPGEAEAVDRFVRFHDRHLLCRMSSACIIPFFPLPSTKGRMGKKRKKMPEKQKKRPVNLDTAEWIW